MAGTVTRRNSTPIVDNSQADGSKPKGGRSRLTAALSSLETHALSNEGVWVAMKYLFHYSACSEPRFKDCRGPGSRPKRGLATSASVDWYRRHAEKRRHCSRYEMAPNSSVSDRLRQLSDSSLIDLPHQIRKFFASPAFRRRAFCSSLPSDHEHPRDAGEYL